MAINHYIRPTAPSKASLTVRLGATATSGDNFSDLEVGKAVKLGGESQFVLAVAGNDIEAIVTSVESAIQNGWSIGGVLDGDIAWARADGLQATPGTGTVAIGDYVVAGSITAKGTALTDWPKVCVATTPANSVYKWRVVSLGTAGTGAVGTTIVIKRV